MHSVRRVNDHLLILLSIMAVIWRYTTVTIQFAGAGRSGNAQGPPMRIYTDGCLRNRANTLRGEGLAVMVPCSFVSICLFAAVKQPEGENIRSAGVCSGDAATIGNGGQPENGSSYLRHGFGDRRVAIWYLGDEALYSRSSGTFTCPSRGYAKQQPQGG